MVFPSNFLTVFNSWSDTFFDKEPVVLVDHPTKSRKKNPYGNEWRIIADGWEIDYFSTLSHHIKRIFKRNLKLIDNIFFQRSTFTAIFTWQSPHVWKFFESETKKNWTQSQIKICWSLNVW